MNPNKPRQLRILIFPKFLSWREQANYRNACKHYKHVQVEDEELIASYQCVRCGKIMDRNDLPSYSKNVSSEYNY